MTTLELGELITAFYDEYLALYGDEDLASVAAAASVNKLVRGDIDIEVDAPVHEEEAAA